MNRPDTPRPVTVGRARPIADRAPCWWAASPASCEQFRLTPPGINLNPLVQPSTRARGARPYKFCRGEEYRLSRSLPSGSSLQCLRQHDSFLQGDRRSTPAPPPSSDDADPRFSQRDLPRVDKVSPRLRTAFSWRAPLPKSRNCALPRRSSLDRVL